MVLQVVADRDNASSPRVGTSKLDTQGTKRAQEHYKFIQHMNIYVLTQSLYSPQFFSLRNSPSTRIQNIPGGQLLNYADQKTASSASSSHFHADLQHHNHHQPISHASRLLGARSQPQQGSPVFLTSAKPGASGCTNDPNNPVRRCQPP